MGDTDKRIYLGPEEIKNFILRYLSYMSEVSLKIEDLKKLRASQDALIFSSPADYDAIYEEECLRLKELRDSARINGPAAINEALRLVLSQLISDREWCDCETRMAQAATAHLQPAPIAAAPTPQMPLYTDEWCRDAAAVTIQSAPTNVAAFNESAFEVSNENFQKSIEEIESIWNRASLLTTILLAITAAFAPAIPAILQSSRVVTIVAFTDFFCIVVAWACILLTLQTQSLITPPLYVQYQAYITQRASQLFPSLPALAAQRVATYEALALMQDDYGIADEENSSRLIKTRRRITQATAAIITGAVLVGILWLTNPNLFPKGV